MSATFCGVPGGEAKASINGGLLGCANCGLAPDTVFVQATTHRGPGNRQRVHSGHVVNGFGRNVFQEGSWSFWSP